MKQTKSQKAWKSLASRIAAMACKLVKLRVRLEESVPVGYEDESGFHTGEPTSEAHV